MHSSNAMVQNHLVTVLAIIASAVVSCSANEFWLASALVHVPDVCSIRPMVNQLGPIPGNEFVSS